MTTPETVLITDEMPDEWVRALADALERFGWTINDAHESAVVVDLPAAAAEVLHADEDGDRLVIGWAGDGEGTGEVHWGLSSDGVHVPVLDTLGEDTDPGAIAARVDRLLRTGQQTPRPLQHAMPYAEITDACRCPTAYPCRGIIPDADCPEHGDRQAPAMSWHWEENCGTVAGR